MRVAVKKVPGRRDHQTGHSVRQNAHTTRTCQRGLQLV